MRTRDNVGRVRLQGVKRKEYESSSKISQPGTVSSNNHSGTCNSVQVRIEDGSAEVLWAPVERFMNHLQATHACRQWKKKTFTLFLNCLLAFYEMLYPTTKSNFRRKKKKKHGHLFRHTNSRVGRVSCKCRDVWGGWYFRYVDEQRRLGQTSFEIFKIKTSYGGFAFGIMT